MFPKTDQNEEARIRPNIKPHICVLKVRREERISKERVKRFSIFRERNQKQCGWVDRTGIQNGYTDGYTDG